MASPDVASSSDGVALLDVLRQHEDPDRRPPVADRDRRPQTVVGVRRGHPDVDDAQVGLVPLDGAEQLVGVADRGDDLLTGIGEDPGQSGPQQHGVLGNHDPHGSSTDTVVGPPFGLITYIVPPSPATRSRRPWRPEPPAGSAPPWPLSRTSTTSRSPALAIDT